MRLNSAQQAWLDSINLWLQQNAAINPEYARSTLGALGQQARALGIDPQDIHIDPKELPPVDNPPGAQPGVTPGVTPYSKPEVFVPAETPPPSPPSSGGGAYDDLIRQASEKYGVSEKLIKAVIAQESGGDPNAVNPTSGCTGLMQLDPRYFSGDLKDPANNIDQGTKELKRLLDKFGGDETLALAHYNLGEFADVNSTVPGQDGLTGLEYAAQVLARV